MDEIKKIGVIGAGVMGQGIIQVFLQAGFEVFFYDSRKEQLDKAEELIHKRLKRKEEKGEISAGELDAILSKTKRATDLSAMREADFILEAVSEDYSVKAKVFRELDKICPPKTIFASNTSSIPIIKLGSATKRQDKFIGMHFMNPPTMVTLVEIIRGKKTSEETFNQVFELSKKIGREMIIESRDKPGFICNRILMTAINEAIWAVYENLGSVEDVNKSVLIGVGTSKPMAILEIADLIGLDICFNILKIMQKGLGRKYQPCPLLKRMVQAGKLGQKTSQGFFFYQTKIK